MIRKPHPCYSKENYKEGQPKYVFHIDIPQQVLETKKHLLLLWDRDFFYVFNRPEPPCTDARGSMGPPTPTS